MRNIFLSFSVFCLSLVAFCACEGTSGGDASLELSADKDRVTVGEQVKFTVKSNGVLDVTSMARIKCEQTGRYLDGSVFVAEEAGEWSFVAESEGLSSNSVNITAEGVFSSPFIKHFCVMEFTGQWCAQCPNGATTLNYFASELYPGIMHILAFHDSDGGYDEFEIPEEDILYKMFRYEGYPGYVLDMKDVGVLTSGTFGEDFNARYKSAAARTGVKISSAISGGHADIRAEIRSEYSSEYRIAAYVIEDKIVAKQNVSGTYNDNYTHRHVVRKMLSADVRGDALGSVAAGAIISRIWSVSLDESWKKENLTVCVLCLDAEGYVDNVAECALDGGSADYQLKK